MRLSRLAERDRGAAEAAACHPRADHSIEAARGFHKVVELRAGNLEIIAQGIVASIHEAAEYGKIIPFQRIHRTDGSRDFTDDMTAAAEGDGIHFLLSTIEIRRGDIAPARLADGGEAVLRAFPAGRVAAVGKLVGNLGVRYEDGQRGIGEGHHLRFRGAAVDEDELVCLSEGGRELIHDPAGHAREIMLRFLRQQRLFARAEGYTREALQQGRHGALQRGGGGKPRAHRQAGDDERIEPRHRDPAQPEALDHAAQVVRPFRIGNFLRRSQQNHRAIGIERSRDANLRSPVRRGGNDHRALDREGQHEAIAVIDVLADQVHPARSYGNCSS